ncbi:MAG: hypothetical protein Q9M17_00515 [Mariprofundus sp.]|nr:hypothetical protein [Mariprofundus sp.]
MGKYFNKKIKLLDIFLVILAFYTVLKFSFSSIDLFIVCVLIIVKSYREGHLMFSKKNIKTFLFTSFYFFLLIISILYSENQESAIKRITRLIPLVIIPGLLYFCKISFTKTKRNFILNIFLFSNVLYAIILGTVYIFYFNHINLYKLSLGSLLSNYQEFQSILDNYLGHNTLFFHKAYFSMGYVMAAIFSLHQLIKNIDINIFKVFIYSFLFLFFSFSILFIFSFPNVLALLISIIAYIWYNHKNRNLIKTPSILIFIITVGGIVFGISYKSNDIDVKRGYNFMKSIIQNKKIDYNDPRIEIYSTINSLYKKASVKEILFGFGIGDVQDKLSKEYLSRLEQANNRNIILFNEEFNDAYWFKNNIVVMPNESISPYGKENADILKETGSKKQLSYNISKKVNLEKGNTYTFSVYAKKGNAKHLILRLGDVSQRATFDLGQGTFKISNKALIKAEILKVNEWYRCSITTQIKGASLIIIGISNKKNQYKYLGNNKRLFLWGAQLEKGANLTEYVKNNNELLKYAAERQLNTHNNYAYFLLAGGALCLLSFLTGIGVLFYISIKNKNIFQLTFCIIIAFNFLTENILSRHWGIMFVSFMLIILFLNKQNAIESEN